MSDFHDEDFPGRPARHRGTPGGRVYVHTPCGGQTLVSGGDYTHICDPFWPCTSTYCCRCAGFAPLNEVEWADTGETVGDYRSRLRRETPGLIKAWRYGVGLLAGGAVGAVAGLLVALLAGVEENRRVGFAILGGMAGALVLYLLGTFLLNRLFGIDYRRMS